MAPTSTLSTSISPKKFKSVSTHLSKYQRTARLALQDPIDSIRRRRRADSQRSCRTRSRRPRSSCWLLQLQQPLAVAREAREAAAVDRAPLQLAAVPRTNREARST